ncbi:hypothetical protein BHE74_00024870 [Ensete ventricosum]|nr:hypothetical protein BHE74_00024870 [Ensete ventricosum]
MPLSVSGGEGGKKKSEDEGGEGTPRGPRPPRRQRWLLWEPGRSDLRFSRYRDLLRASHPLLQLLVCCLPQDLMNLACQEASYWHMRSPLSNLITQVFCTSGHSSSMGASAWPLAASLSETLAPFCTLIHAPTYASIRNDNLVKEQSVNHVWSLVQKKREREREREREGIAVSDLQIVVPIEGFGADGARELHWACEDLIRCWDPVLTPAVHSAQLLHLLLLLLLQEDVSPRRRQSDTQSDGILTHLVFLFDGLLLIWRRRRRGGWGLEPLEETRRVGGEAIHGRARISSAEGERGRVLMSKHGSPIWSKGTVAVFFPKSLNDDGLAALPTSGFARKSFQREHVPLARAHEETTRLVVRHYTTFCSHAV